MDTVRILVVDDDPQTARLVREWYRNQPFVILEAGDGDEGVHRAASEHPDIILMDLMMPRTNGFAASKRLKSSAATRNIPVILLSAKRDPQTKREGFDDAGIDDYVEKPFNFDEVDARIRAMLRKREVLLTLETTNRELQASNAQLEEMATIDSKTGLANYRLFIKRLHEEWVRSERYGQALSLVMLDLDDFKRINDTLGHQAGDRALREFAMLVSGGARATDLPARYGGEEFAVLLPHTEGEQAERVAERIRAAVAEFNFLESDHRLSLTVSAGVATFPSNSEIASADQLVAAADRALYAAKKAGKNRIVVAPA
ncbi:MAG TPA: diguanylate cyclase [Candidatus Polarisedimenticolaceae bacterium]|nr:diguanylate cyclase [Candidatus Polarisedimenticolaceae bacterium]